VHAASLAVIGFSERYRQPTEPLVHVVAIGGALSLAHLTVNLMARRRGPFVPSAAPSGERGLAPN
jgi:hypothetical protein